MAGGYQTPPGDGYQQLKERLRRLEVRMSEREKPASLEGLTSYGSIGTSVTAFSLNSAFADKCSGVMAVPSGFTTVTVLAVANMAVQNNAAGTNYPQLRVTINGIGGGETIDQAAASAYVTMSANAIRTFSVVGMASFPITASARSQIMDLPVDSVNIINLDAIAMFGRG